MEAMLLNELELTGEVSIPEKYVGPRGYSAYELAVKEGFEGTIEEWLESLHGEVSFADLTDEQKEQLRGRDGKDGRDGQDAVSAINPRGNWDENETYNRNDYVTFLENGNSYTCMVDDTTGISPLDTSVWQVLALKGADGKPGTDGKDGLPGNTTLIYTKIIEVPTNHLVENIPFADFNRKPILGEQVMGLGTTNGGTITTNTRGYFVGKITRIVDDLTADIEVEAAVFTHDGAVGATGPQGKKGDQGDKGDKGDTGDVGPKGDKGDKGDAFTFDDFTSEQLASLKGDKGDKGDVGPQGPQGEKGADGTMTFEDLTAEQKESLRGPQGIQGEPGKDGADGKDGKDGEQGPQGIQGEQGEKGDKGDQGEQGIQGPAGADGKDGAKGEKGDPGETGPQGEKGEKGDTGEKGADGAQGEQGPAGEDGYTPVKGTDYWTAADKKEITDYVDDYFGDVNAALEAILKGGGAVSLIAYTDENDEELLHIEEPCCGKIEDNKLVINDRTAEVKIVDEN